MKITQSVARWEFLFFSAKNSKSPIKRLFEPEAAIAYMTKALKNRKLREQGLHMEIMHVPSGLRREIGSIKEAEFVIDGLISRLGEKLYVTRH